MRKLTFVDTGAWFALYVPQDPDHIAACSWLAANRPVLVTTDYVIDETLTLLRARGRRNTVIEFGEDVYAGKLGTICYLTKEQIAAAWDTFRRFADKDWSFTDCTSKVVMESLGIAEAFSFDHHFRQFGTVTVVP